MRELKANRTLVKSPPELWAECSDAASLARHLGAFGEIRITRLEPETAVAWEGDNASGTVRLEPSGWGTRVMLTARLAPPGAEPVAPDAPAPGTRPAPEPELGAEPELGPEPAPALAPPAHARPRRWSLVVRLAEALGWRPSPAPVAGVEAQAVESARVESARVESARVGSADVESAALESPAVGSEAVGSEAVEPEALELPAGEPAPPGPEIDLTAVLDSLGQAHHRPFSRA